MSTLPWRPPVVWTVSGSDSGGGAGLQADLRAFERWGVHGCTAVTAVTAQHSRAVVAVQPVPADQLERQLQALAEDLPPAAIKTGLFADAAQVAAVAHIVRGLRGRGVLVPLVVDPVAGASTGAAFGGEAVRRALWEHLLPLADVVTPNRVEAGWLLGRDVPRGWDAAMQVARELQRRGLRTVVVTGGDAAPAGIGTGAGPASADGDEAVDALCSPQAVGWLIGSRCATPHTHGSGCTFASSIAAALAHGHCEADAAVYAKALVHDALQRPRLAGQGAGPVVPRDGFATRIASFPRFRPVGGRPARFAASAPLGLVPIVDDAAWLSRLAATGVGTLQLRIKNASAAVVDAQVRQAVEEARRRDLRLFINDHWQSALRHGAHGVHLGQGDLRDADVEALAHAGLALGVSTHSAWEVARALDLSPSYVACGPVHATRTKDMPWRPQGEGNLAYWSALLQQPVVAIGGMNPARAAAAWRCGARGVAVLGGITQAPQPLDAVRAYQDAMSQAASGAPAEAAVPPWPAPTLPPGAPAPPG